MGRVSSGLRADHRIELLPDLAGDSPRPTGPNLAHVDKVFTFLLAQIERRDTRWVFDKPDDGKLTRVDRLDLQPVLVALRTVRSVCPL